MKNVILKDIKSEINIKTSRSGGAGGQHVNKVESKVQLFFNIEQSSVLTTSQKEILTEKLANKINKEGDLIITAEEERSQLKNKEIAFKKLDRLLKKAFHKPLKRKKTKPKKSAIEKRIKHKKIQGEKKEMRKKLL